MRASQQTAKQPAGGQGPAVMTRRRPGLGDHAATAAYDRHERQADEAAVRALRGEKDLARLLRPAPAAGFRLPTSRGEPLPRLLREEMETAFGADLTAVCVHRDAAAAATRRRGALAFAAGRDLYFGAGRYDPASAAGRG